MKLRSVKWSDRALLLDADVSTSAGASFEVKTPLKAIRAEGANLRAIAAGLYKLTLPAPTPAEDRSGYRRSQIKIEFAEK